MCQDWSIAQHIYCTLACILKLIWEIVCGMGIFGSILEMNSGTSLHYHETIVHLSQFHDHIGILKLFRMGEFILQQLANATIRVSTFLKGNY